MAARQNFAAQLAPPQPPTYVADYDTNVPSKIFAGTPRHATVNDLRIVAGQVAMMADRMPQPPQPGVQTQKYYQDKPGHCQMSGPGHMPMMGQQVFDSMSQCQAFGK